MEKVDKNKVILHIDMNSYFASCEQQANPFLRGKPIGICEHLGGIIIAPSIEAKKLGIKTGTPVWEARKIYPKILLFKTDPDKYRDTTRKFLSIFYKYTESIQKYSIDEAFLDLSLEVKSAPDPWVRAEEIGREIKLEMKKYVGDWISCSIGIGANKLVAKIASDLEKPNGLVVVRPDNKEFLYDRLVLTDIPGIAHRMEKQLNYLGIKTLRDLRDYPYSKLIVHFGIAGYHLHKMGQLEGTWKEDEFENSGVPDPLIKSMGHAYTMPEATVDQEVAKQVLFKLSEMVGRRMRESEMMGNVVHFVTKSKEREYFDRGHKLSFDIQDGKDIYFHAAKILEDAYKAGELPSNLRLIGVTVAGLKPFSNQQSLFEKDRTNYELVKSMDKINDKYGDFTISSLPAWQARKYVRDSVGFGRMKEFKVKFKPGK